MKKIILIFASILCLTAVAIAQEEKNYETTVEVGYKFYSVDKNPSIVNEYSNSTSFPLLKLATKGYSESYKYNIILDVNEKEDYNFDIHAYYQDKFRIEMTGNYLDHNLGFKDNKAMTSLSLDEEYFVKFRNQMATLKYKPFTYPFHIRVSAEKIEKEGDYQKRFYGNSSLNPAYSSSDDIFSRKAPVNYVTNVSGVAVDGLLGGVLFYLEASKTNFRDEAKITDDMLLKSPQFEENSYSLKLNSNQAGKISYALSFKRIERDNEGHDEIKRAGATSSYNNTGFFLSFYPESRLKVSFKASYEDYDQNNPDFWRYNGTDYVASYATSYIRKSAQINAKYIITKNSYFSATLKGKEQERDTIYFSMPEYTSQTSAKIEFGTSIKDKCSLKISQSYVHNNNPPYKNVAENSHKTNLSFEHTISDSMWFDVNASYLFETSNDSFTYFVESKTKSINANFFFTPSDTLNLGSYGLIEIQDYKSDLNFGKPTTAEYIISRTPYEAKTYQLGLNANKRFSVKQEVYGDIFYLRGYGTYMPQFVSGVVGSYSYDTTDLARLAEVDFYQYGLLLGTKYKLSFKDTLKCEVSYKDHNENADTALNGSIKTFFVSWERKW